MLKPSDAENATSESSDAEKQNRYDDRSLKMLEGKGLP